MATPHHEGGAGGHEAHGVVLPDFGDNSHQEFSTDFYGTTVGILTARVHAKRAVEGGLELGDRTGDNDPRMVTIRAGGGDKPRARFLLDAPLVATITSIADGRPEDLTHNEVARLGAANTVNAVNPRFTPDAINAINISYFESPIAFTPEAGLANAFNDSIVLNILMGAFLGDRVGKPGEFLRIKELAAGALPEHWQVAADAATISEGTISGAAGVELTLTDFFAPPIPGDLENDQLRVQSEAYSLLDDLPNLPPDQRFDVLMATYGFDSVWQPEDMRLTRIGGRWYQSLMRVKVDDWSPRQQELITAMRAREPLPDATATDYEGIYVEEVMEEIDRSQVPYADILEESREHVTINYPGGLIKRAVQAFDRQLNDDGIFMSIDIADIQQPTLTPSPADVSGVAERFKIENYHVAAKILEREHGLHVEFISLTQLVARYMPPGWEKFALPYELQAIQEGSVDVMVVSRRAPEAP